MEGSYIPSPGPNGMKSPTPQDLIKVVLECKGDVNQSNTDGTTPLFMASEFADIETVRKLKGREGSGLLDHLVNIPVSAEKKNIPVSAGEKKKS